MKMPKKSSTTNNQQAVSQDPQPNRCHFETSDGRRCRMLRHNGHPTLCLFHARDEMQILESQRLGAELSASLSGRFMTATDINFVLGKLFTATAQNRIPPRNAAVLAYIAQLMLHSLPISKTNSASSISSSSGTTCSTTPPTSPIPPSSSTPLPIPPPPAKTPARYTPTFPPPILIPFPSLAPTPHPTTIPETPNPTTCSPFRHPHPSGTRRGGRPLFLSPPRPLRSRCAR